MKKIIFYATASVFIVFIVSCTSRLHWYYLKMHVSDLSDYVYWTFDNCKLTLDGNKLYNMKSKSTGSKFYYTNGDYSYYHMINEIWSNKKDSAIYPKLVKYLKTRDEIELKEITFGIWKKNYGDIYSNGEILPDPISSKKTKQLRSKPIIGVYPSLNIKEVESDVTKSRSVLDLKPEAQNTYVSEMLKDRSRLYKNDTLALKIFMDVEASAQKDVIHPKADVPDKSKKVRITVSTQNLCTEPADRIVKATFKIYSQDIEFKGWSGTKLDWSTMSLGSQESTIANSFHLNGGLNAKDTTLGISGGYNYSNSNMEKFNFSKRYVVFAGGVYKHYINIFQEGVPGIDLSGSISFDSKIEFKGKQNDTLLLLSSIYTIRHVCNKGSRIWGKGGRTYIEGDDKVEYITINIVKPYLYSHFN